MPLIPDVVLARANPALAVISAISHGDTTEVDAMFPALAEALQTVDPKAMIYHDVLLAGLPEATWARWEAFLATISDGTDFAETLRELIAQDKKPDAIYGKIRALQLVLYGRGVWVPDDARDQIFNCTDVATLNRWLIRASRAHTIEDVVGA